MSNIYYIKESASIYYNKDRRVGNEFLLGTPFNNIFCAT